MDFQSQATNVFEHLSEIEKWSNIAKRWTNYLPPFRPTTNDLKLFQEITLTHLSSHLKINALVLGATPELRDLLFMLGASITIVDQNPRMVEAMSGLRVYTGHEDIYIDDWFQFLPTRKQSFDLIVSDLTQGNIPYDKQEDFFRLISEALVPGGLYIDRAFTFRDRSRLYIADEEFNRFSEMPVINIASINEMFYNCFCASDLLFRLGTVDVHAIYSHMRNELKSDVLKKYATLMNEYLAPEATVWYYGKDWNEVSKIYFRHLHLITEIPNHEEAYRGIPFILASNPK